MALRREHPYIWTTWLPRLFTGENSCEWAAWFRAQFQDWTRQPSDFNQTEWLLQHTTLLNEQKAQWDAHGHAVLVEGQNSFRLRGQSATLAGKPDLMVVRDKDALIIDVKTGKEQPWHAVQVMIYQYAIPRALPQYKGMRMAGEVVCPSRTVKVPTGALPGQFIEDLGALIRRLAADQPAQRVPSAQKCRFCDISAADCPQRVEVGSEPAGGTTTDF